MWEVRGGCGLWLRVLASELGLMEPVPSQEHWRKAEVGGGGVALSLVGEEVVTGSVRGLWPADAELGTTGSYQRGPSLEPPVSLGLESASVSVGCSNTFTH